ncbi:DUF1467 family protein [Aquamicrobium soli]|jgi:predicted secreted protein|uniref:DUF1467 family protein n=1 Tax=Aquamicrobium soli TaxID=1811518 RepID=A0ABV7KFW8_9HYPH
MNWISFTAMYFVVWWITLFAVLPFGLKTQDEDENVTLGTVASAPRGPHMLRVVIWTTILASTLMGLAFFVVNILGLGFDDIPSVIPEFK